MFYQGTMSFEKNRITSLVHAKHIDRIGRTEILRKYPELDLLTLQQTLISIEICSFLTSERLENCIHLNQNPVPCNIQEAIIMGILKGYCKIFLPHKFPSLWTWLIFNHLWQKSTHGRYTHGIKWKGVLSNWL